MGRLPGRPTILAGAATPDTEGGMVLAFIAVGGRGVWGRRARRPRRDHLGQLVPLHLFFRVSPRAPPQHRFFRIFRAFVTTGAAMLDLWPHRTPCSGARGSTPPRLVYFCTSSYKPLAYSTTNARLRISASIRAHLHRVATRCRRFRRGSTLDG